MNFASTCTSCPFNSNRIMNPTGQCLCAAKYYPTPEIVNCSPCYYACGLCIGPSSSNCTSCNILSYRIATASVCICMDGYTDDGVNEMC